ncbi:TPA: hypothetical protein MYP09_001449 [Citrobacter farmeri]|nr:hypothetical protein [Citrobacter farmeri]
MKSLTIINGEVAPYGLKIVAITTEVEMTPTYYLLKNVPDTKCNKFKRMMSIINPTAQGQIIFSSKDVDEVLKALGEEIKKIGTGA